MDDILGQYDWSDVEPVAQDDGEHPVVSIAYPSHFVKVMDVFRGVLRTGEKSARTLALTEAVIDLNAANYTAWQFRRECLVALGSDLAAELAYVEGVSAVSPKNYQLWFHRRKVVEMLGDASGEMPFVEKVHAGDAKNYHAWSHLQWVTATFGLWDAQVSYATRLIEEDVRNNSAWNHRWFATHGRRAASGDPGKAKKDGAEAAVSATHAPLSVSAREAVLSAEESASEASYAVEKIAWGPNNESPWLYLRALVKEQRRLRGRCGAEMFPDAYGRIAKLRQRDAHGNCRHLLSFAYDDASDDARTLAAGGDREGAARRLEEAAAALRRLCEVDGVRRGFWTRRLAKIAERQGASAATADGDAAEVAETAKGAAAATAAAAPLEAP